MFKKQIQQLETRIEQNLDQTGRPSFLSFEWFLAITAFIYGLGVRCRLFLYGKGFFKTSKLPCQVISVGNIVAGGAGKTPMVMYLAQVLKKMGKKPVVVSRGYKGDYSGRPLVVSDGKKTFCSVFVCGDEPYMMAQRKTFPVVIGKNRNAAGRLAVETLGCDTILLDDGFQHMALERDVNLLLMDWKNPLGNQRLLPAGRLREPLHTALTRSDAVIFTRSPEQHEVLAKPNQILAQICTKTEPCFFASHVPILVENIPANGADKKRFTDLSSLSGKKAVLFSGIAANQNFYQTVEKIGVNIVSHLEFQDHYRYKRADIEKINRLAGKLQADVILTTEKDWVKIDQASAWQTDVAVIGIDLCFRDADRFNAYLKTRLE